MSKRKARRKIKAKKSTDIIDGTGVPVPALADIAGPYAGRIKSDGTVHITHATLVRPKG